MLIKILIAVAVMVVVFVIIVVLQPGSFRVSRKISIAAPLPTVFALVNDLHRWEGWSPWVKLDPLMKQTYAGPAAGEGASYSWSGNNNVGEGRMTIRESRPHDHIDIQLDFIRPFVGTNDVEFTFVPEGPGTTVTWTMVGTKNFFTKAFGLFMSMDKMVGGQFEQGLASMKSLAEAATPN